MTTPMKGNRGKNAIPGFNLLYAIMSQVIHEKMTYNLISFSPMSIRLRSSNQQYGSKLGWGVLPCGDVSFHDVSDPCVDSVPVHCNCHAPMT